MKITERLRSMLEYIEAPGVPFVFPVLLFFSAVTLRTFLEFFSDKAKILFSLFPPEQFIYYAQWVSFAISLLHYYLYWIALSLAIGLILYVITKERMERICRAVFTCFILIAITPLFDLLTTGGAGHSINYVYPKTIGEFLPIPKGLTPGMLYTCSVAFISSFLYAYAKTKSCRKAAGGTLLIYMLLLATSVLPLALGTRSPLVLVRVLLIVIVAQLLIIQGIQNKAHLFSLIKDMRWLKYLYFQLLCVAGMLLSKSPLSTILPVNLDALLLMGLATTLCWCASVMFNNVSDYQLDLIGAPGRPLPSGKFAQGEYQKIARYTLLLAFACSLGVNFQTFFFVLLFSGNSFLYSLPPLRLKRLLIFSKLCLAINALAAFMLGYIFAGGALLQFPAPIVWYFLIFVTLIFNFYDIKSYEADRQVGLATLPVALGPGAATLVIAGVCMLGYCMLSFVFLDLRLLVPLFLLGGVQFFFITRKNYSENAVLLVQIAFVLLVVTYLAFVRVPF